jgi:hypothetical protein
MLSRIARVKPFLSRRAVAVVAAATVAGGALAVAAPGGSAGALIPSPTSVPSPIEAGGLSPSWQANGYVDPKPPPAIPFTPGVSGSQLILTPTPGDPLTKPGPHLGSTVWFKQPVPTADQAFEVSFTAHLDGEFTPSPTDTNHADGLTFAFVDGTANDASANNGSAGGFLGFGAVPGTHNLALALNTYESSNGQTLNRVGFLTNYDNPDTKAWVSTPTDLSSPQLWSQSPSGGVQVAVSIYPNPSSPGVWNASLKLNGQPISGQQGVPVRLPDVAILGFTAGTGAYAERQAVENVQIAYGATGGSPFHALAPTRILDTRTSGGPIGPNSIRTVQVIGVGGVPSSGVSAVMLNVTATEPSQPGYVTVFPTGAPTPTASNLNFLPGQNIANLVTAKVGANGSVTIYNFSGTTQVLFDVVGYFTDTTVPGFTLKAQADDGGRFVPLSPARVLDTRSGLGAPMTPLGPNGQLTLQIAGRGGVPASGADAVVMNLTATNTTAPSFLTAWPAGTPRQVTSNLNFTAGTNVPNLAVVKLGAGGAVSIYNFDGNADVVADVVGYYTSAGTAGGSLFHAVTPVRYLDTRTGLGAPQAPLGKDGLIGLQITGGVIPASATAVVVNVTATNTTQPGFLTVYPAGEPRPLASNLNYVGGQTVPNLVMAKLGAGGRIAIYSFAGPTDVVGDVVGWYGPT